MGLLNREQILLADDLQTEDVPVPEWGGMVRVRALTAGERDRWEAATYLDAQGGRVQTPEDIRAKLVALTCVDETGALMFSLDDVAALTKKNGAAMTRVYAVSSRLSFVTSADVEELAKN
jgi:hypothetical protein